MPDTVETQPTTTAPEATPPSTPGDAIRADIDKASEGGDVLPTGTADAAEKPEATPTAAAAAAVTLTDEQITAALSDPRVIRGVFESDAAMPTIEQMVAEAQKTAEAERVAAAEADARRLTLEEALKKGTEEGDFSDFGRLVAEQYTAEQQRAATEAAIAPEVRSRAYEELDAAVLDAFGPDVVKKLSELDADERQKLSRDNFASEGEFTRAVLTKLVEIRDETVLAAARPELSAAVIAQRNGATAAASRADALTVPTLPAGTADEKLTGTESIGELIRAGIGKHLEDSEDSLL